MEDMGALLEALEVDDTLSPSDLLALAPPKETNDTTRVFSALLLATGRRGKSTLIKALLRAMFSDPTYNIGVVAIFSPTDDWADMVGEYLDSAGRDRVRVYETYDEAAVAHMTSRKIRRRLRKSGKSAWLVVDDVALTKAQYEGTLTDLFRDGRQHNIGLIVANQTTKHRITPTMKKATNFTMFAGMSNIEADEMYKGFAVRQRPAEFREWALDLWTGDNAGKYLFGAYVHQTARLCVVKARI